MKFVFCSVFAVFFSCYCYSQGNNYLLHLEAQTSAISDSQVPFWLRSNQYGSVPLSGLSASFLARAQKNYDSTSKFFDVGAAVEARANLGKETRLLLIEGYGKIKLGVFEIKGGRMKESFGLTDTLLSTGNFAISGNSLGIPKIQLSIPEFTYIPFLKKVLAVKGVYAQGWVGTVPIQNKRVTEAVTYFHQKAIYFRLGQPNWRLKLYGGFADQVFYGNEAKIFESFILTDWQKYRSVVFGKNWAFSKVGNHAGNIDIRLEYTFPTFLMSVYRQNFYEVGALYHLANIADGITGLSIVNRKTEAKKFFWKRFVFEFLYTKNQAGERWSKPTPTGNEDYHNHYLYQEGWSYRQANLGTPFITPAYLARADLPSEATNYFINNRVSVFHIGSQFRFLNCDFMNKFSYSTNFGTHQTRRTFPTVNQFSGYMEAHRDLRKGYNVGVVAALDAGKLLYNTSGVIFSVSKRF
ncbi:capsule assembly Wzi family protein [Dyadobacter aurulentus]|uniref:capsule assembly Wzi family protein n=1 Tax=Dyadobacter sp. UC 10 TaxID=2605428 RepID=UPI0011F1A585|nr:capsule assembly Wzi family protein [Dyadobacter sp. UC 10]KAA0988860.1 capsule assembly Wzi family protein [Dyadobacter sp. UC 10]